MAGVSRPALTKACRNELKPAVVNGRIHLDHPAVVAYLRRHGAEVPTPAAREPKPAKPASGGARPQPARRKRVVASPQAEPAVSPPASDSEGGDSDDLPPDLEIPEDIDRDELARMTLRQIARRFGTWRQFETILTALKTLAEIRLKDDRHREFEGSVVTRKLVQTHAIGALEKLSRHLAKPVPDTVAARVIDMHTGGKPVEEIRKVAREIMGAELRATWAEVAAALRKK
jgi:hypothetical protein